MSGVGNAMLRIFVCQCLILMLTREMSCTEENDKYVYAVTVAQWVVDTLYKAFSNCMRLPMTTHMYATDDIQRFLNSRGRTTVGLTKEFAQNRKFLANLLTHPAFQRMIAADETKIRRSIQDKMRFCRDAVVDRELLHNFYFRDNGQGWSHR